MYKLGRWLYALGARNEQKRLKADLYYYLGWQPERMEDREAGLRESDAHYNKRIDAWFATRELVEKFFAEVEGKPK